jgi:uncharacterized membrane protein
VALREPATAASLRRAFRADAMWGIAALLWLSTGLWRLLAGTEKPLGYYMQNHVFFGKMGLFLVILALEIMPAVTLARWRRALARGDAPETIAAPASRPPQRPGESPRSPTSRRCWWCSSCSRRCRWREGWARCETPG